MKSQYKIIGPLRLFKLVEEVNNHIKNGWVPHGPAMPVTDQQQGSNTIIVAIQTMTRVEISPSVPKDNQGISDERDLFIVEEAALRLNWHPESLRRAIRDGRVKAIKVGKSWRISTEEMERIVKEGLPK